MIGEILMAAKAVPGILKCLERLADAQTVLAAQQRREGKDELLEDLIARARDSRDERVREREVPGPGEPGGGQP